MRYRRLAYRYSLLLTRSGLEPLRAGGRTDGGVRFGQTCWTPPADVYETPQALVITAELAGVNHEEVDVLLFEDALVVEGERRLAADPEAVYHSAEIRQGRFRLELPIPPSVDRERVDARYDRGVLRIIITKSEVK